MRGADDGGRSRLHRERAVLYLAVGFVLVSGPAVAGPVGERLEPEPAYTYEAVEVVPESGSLAFEGPLPDDGVEGSTVWSTTPGCAGSKSDSSTGT